MPKGTITSRTYRQRSFGAALGVVAILAGLAMTVLAAPAGATRSRTTPVAQIRANWATFFSGKTPAAKKIGLVQDGKAFAAVIRAQARSAIAASSTAKVTKVALRSKTEANVVYTVLLDGQPALKDAKGTAVYLQHTWKVSAQSFCSLLALEQLKPAACAKLR